MKLDKGAYMTLLEVTGPAPATATYKRNANLLKRLVDEGLVEVFRPRTEAEKRITKDAAMRVTDKGLEALRMHRNAGYNVEVRHEKCPECWHSWEEHGPTGCRNSQWINNLHLKCQCERTRNDF